MPDARISEVADGAQAVIDAAWTGKGANDAVTVEYELPVRESEVNQLVGRKVYVFEEGYGNVGITARGKDLNEYRIKVMCVERYTTAGRVSKTWARERVKFVAEKIVDALDFTREADGRLLTTLWTETINVESVYVAEFMSGENGRLFWSEIEFAFREEATA